MHEKIKSLKAKPINEYDNLLHMSNIATYQNVIGLISADIVRIFCRFPFTNRRENHV